MTARESTRVDVDDEAFEDLALSITPPRRSGASMVARERTGELIASVREAIETYDSLSRPGVADVTAMAGRLLYRASQLAAWAERLLADTAPVVPS